VALELEPPAPLSSSTARSYAAIWDLFTDWCDVTGHPPLPDAAADGDVAGGHPGQLQIRDPGELGQDQQAPVALAEQPAGLAAAGKARSAASTRDRISNAIGTGSIGGRPTAARTCGSADCPAAAATLRRRVIAIDHQHTAVGHSAPGDPRPGVRIASTMPWWLTDPPVETRRRGCTLTLSKPSRGELLAGS
jgi:hypothetical protein